MVSIRLTRGLIRTHYILLLCQGESDSKELDRLSDSHKGLVRLENFVEVSISLLFGILLLFCYVLYVSEQQQLIAAEVRKVEDLYVRLHSRLETMDVVLNSILHGSSSGPFTSVTTSFVLKSSLCFPFIFPVAFRFDLS